jgi:hypothetical protein
MRIHERAYEIYLLRGGEPGHQAEDWFQAESEILRILIDEDSRGKDGDGLPAAFEPRTAHESAERSADTRPQTAAERAESHSALGVWSPTEPPSASLAPEIGEAPKTEPVTPKKKAKSSAAKPATPRKRKAAEEKDAGTKKAAGSKASKKSKKE